ncbi:MAG: vitamin K epoxide reductase family protein [Candidatus Hydrogenedentota bacterium]
MHEETAARHSAMAVFVWVTYLVAAGAGLALTLYLTAAHFTGQLYAVCAPGTGCGAVLESDLAVIFGVPTATYGLLFYVTLFIGALLYPTIQPNYQALAVNVGVILTGLGVIISLLLTIYSYLAVEAFCHFCLASFALVALLAGLVTYWKHGALNRRGAKSTQLGRRVSRIAMRVSVVLLLGVGILFVHALGPPGGADPQAQLEQDFDDFGRAIGRPGGALGDPEAPHQVIEFFDLECPACREFAREVFPEIKERYIDTGRVYWILVPYPLEMYPNSFPAHIAHELVPFDQYYEAKLELMENADRWGSSATDDPIPYLEEFLADHGLSSDLIAEERREVLRSHQERVRRLLGGVEASPVFIINGEPRTGSPTLGQWGALFAEP